MELSGKIIAVLEAKKRTTHRAGNPWMKQEYVIEAGQLLLEIDKPIYEIFSNLGVMKLRTCMLLFASISDEPVFKQVLRKYGWK